MDLDQASERAMEVRALYHQLEERHEGSAWSRKDDMLGLVNDVGALSRLVMAADGRWAPEGDLGELTEGKLAECLWWILVLARRLDIDIDDAFVGTMDRIRSHLETSVATGSSGAAPSPRSAGDAPDEQ
jgi:NTP pyrophosphatase (non-canonical NTP hydrolase)